MAPPVNRPDQLTVRQRMIMASLREGHRALLRFAAFTGKFTGYVSVFNTMRGRAELAPWFSIKAMIDRGLVRLDGTCTQTSREADRVNSVLLIPKYAFDSGEDGERSSWRWQKRGDNTGSLTRGSAARSRIAMPAALLASNSMEHRPSPRPGNPHRWTDGCPGRFELAELILVCLT